VGVSPGIKQQQREDDDILASSIQISGLTLNDVSLPPLSVFPTTGIFSGWHKTKNIDHERRAPPSYMTFIPSVIKFIHYIKIYGVASMH
jgi:hypothetical protein